jgi:hypothetical protein
MTPTNMVLMVLNMVAFGIEVASRPTGASLVP